MKPKINSKILLFLLSSMFIIQCEENCPEFNRDILNWVPYKLNDTISFYKNDSVSNLVAFENQINHGEVEEFHLGCQKCSPCDQDEYAVSMTFDSVNIQIRYFSSRNPSNSSIILRDMANSIETGIYPDLSIGNYELNGKNYGDVMVYNNSNNPISGSKIQKVIIAKNYGIIAIYEVQDTWYLYGESKREIKISEIKYNGMEGC
jgi:hypothetical protein